MLAFLRHLFLTLCVFGSCPLAFCDEWYASSEQLLHKVGIEREKIFQYHVKIKVQGELSTAEELFGFRVDDRSAIELYVEYCRLGGHFISGARECSTAANASWAFLGRSGDLTIEANSIVGLNTSQVSPLQLRRYPLSELLVFDPRAVGLLSHDGLQSAMTFERAMRGLRQFNQVPSKTYKFEEKWYVFWPDLGLRIAFDPKNSFWPTTFEHVTPGSLLRQKWDVKIGKYDAFDVPVEAVYSREQFEGDEMKKKTLTLGFHWEAINQINPIGHKAAARLKERFQIPDVVTDSGSPFNAAGDK